MRNAGLTKVAHAKIAEHKMYPVPILVSPDVSLNKYVWIRDSAMEQIEFCDHMIAEFQRRKTMIMNNPDDTGEYFREYVQTTNIDSEGPVAFLSLMHGPDLDSEKYSTLVKIKEYDWSEQDIADELFKGEQVNG